MHMPRGRGGGAAVSVKKKKAKKKQGGGVVKLSITSPSGEQRLKPLARERASLMETENR